MTYAIDGWDFMEDHNQSILRAPGELKRPIALHSDFGQTGALSKENMWTHTKNKHKKDTTAFWLGSSAEDTTTYVRDFKHKKDTTASWLGSSVEDTTAYVRYSHVIIFVPLKTTSSTHHTHPIICQWVCTITKQYGNKPSMAPGILTMRKCPGATHHIRLG